MKVSIILTVPLLVASASAWAYPGNGNKDKGKGKVVDAALDPNKAPQTIQNAQEHVGKHGQGTMQAQVKDFNDDKTKADLRKAAIGGKGEKGKVIDEEAPALWRKPTDPVSTKATDKKEGPHQGGVLGAAKQKAEKLGPEATLRQTVKGVPGPMTGTGSTDPPSANTRSKDKGKKKNKRAVLYARMAEAEAEAEAYAEAFAGAVAELDALTLHARALDKRDSIFKRAAKPEAYTIQERYAEPDQYYARDVEPSVHDLFGRGLMSESYNFVY
ncbi:hypothetical protein MMC30_006562 [Trapelia coarctata]|nr:hypothetical protein [Trapelia coarctata]